MRPIGLTPDDFKRLAKDGVRFEALTKQLLEAMGFHILEEPGAGPDAGCDVLVEHVLKNAMTERRERVLVQCKHYAHSGKSVGDTDVGNWQNAMARFRAKGYLLVTSSDVTKNLIRAFNEFTKDEANYPKWAAAWTMEELIQRLNEYPQVRDRFFPPAPLPESPALAAEVRGSLEAMGFELLEEFQEDDMVGFRARVIAKGEQSERWYLCLERGVTVDDVKSLQRCIEAVPGSKGWIITLFHAVDSDAEKLLDSSPSITAQSLANFYRQMLQCERYLSELMEGGREVEKYWVALECGFGEKTGSFDLVNYVDGWVHSPARNHLALLGDFGTGKTWFCRHYAARAARQYMQDPDHHRIPILVSLRGYTKALKIEQLITDTLVNTYGIELDGGFETFMQLNRCGRLLLIFDGFDEMEQRVEYDVAVRNYEEISRTVVSESKVILTSRPLFFADAEQLQKILKKDFEILTLRVFNDAQIQEVLRKRVPHKWKKCWKQIRGIQQLRDLASRPVMTQIISETLPTVLDLGQIDSAALYRTYIVDTWIEEACRRDRQLLKIKDEVLSFIRDLAWETFRSPTMGTFSQSELRQYVRNIPGSDTWALRLEQLFVLDRATGNFTFPHISFVEYFVADVVAQGLSTGDGQYLFSSKLTDGVQEFLIDLIRSKPEAQAGILDALLCAQPGKQTDTLVELLTRWGDGNPVRPVVQILTTSDYTPEDLPKHVVAALGKEEFLDDAIRQPTQEPSLPVRHFLLELLGSPEIDTARALKELLPATFENLDRQVRLHAVRVLGKRQKEKELQALIQAITRRDMPVEIREACIKNLHASSLADDSVRGKVLNALHQVINDDQDDVDFRRHCVVQLAPYNSREALEPLLVILEDFGHVLWYVAADTISQTRVLSLADEIEINIIVPYQSDHSLIRQIAFLKAAVETIRRSEQRGE